MKKCDSNIKYRAEDEDRGFPNITQYGYNWTRTNTLEANLDQFEMTIEHIQTWVPTIVVKERP